MLAFSGALPSLVAPGATATVNVNYLSTVVGTQTMQLRVTTNDSDENPYNFTISGTVGAAPPPAIATVGTQASVNAANTLSFTVPAGSNRLLVVTVLGFASGLPLALTGQAMQAWLSLEGLEGKLFAPVALTIVFALAVSLLLSFTVVPRPIAWVVTLGQDGSRNAAPFSFFNVVAWGTLGENAAASLTKGNRIIVTGRLEQRSYETKEGEKRSVVEIIADEIGPSLRWARAEVERIARDGGSGGGGGGQGGGSGSSGFNRAPDPVYGDEEPF
mgnify:CR=1 FL=1